MRKGTPAGATLKVGRLGSERAGVQTSTTPGATPRPGASALPGGATATPVSPSVAPPSPPTGAPVVRRGAVHRSTRAGEDEDAIAGARIVAYAARGPVSVTSAADGSFTLPTAEADAEVLTTAPGYIPSLVVGWEGGPLVLHLGRQLDPRPPGTVPVKVTGTVRDAGGSPVAGAEVQGGNANGFSFGPAVCDAEGRFAVDAASPDGAQPADVAIWAWRKEATGDLEVLGYNAGLSVGAGQPGAVVTVEPVTQALTIVPGVFTASASLSLDIAAPNGVAVRLVGGTVGPEGIDLPYRKPLGAVLTLTISQDEGDAHSHWRQRVEAAGAVVPALLPFPEAPSLAGGLVEGTAIAWPMVAGATGYRLSTSADDPATPTWEAFTPQASLTLRGLVAGAKTLSLTAVDDVEAIRTVAAVGEARQLRWGHNGEGRESWRRVTLP